MLLQEAIEHLETQFETAKDMDTSFSKI